MVSELGVTVAVPTLNRGAFLVNCLRDLMAQHQRPLEILVVDQSAVVDREVTQIAEEHAGLISYHRVGFRGLPLARNYAWRHAKYGAIVYVDDDIRCGPTLVAEHLRALRMPGVGIVAGGIDEAHKPIDRGPPTGTFNPWTATCARGFAANGEQDVCHVPGGNFSAWREVIRAAGGFDERLNVGAALYEELDFCLRARQAGYRIYFNGNARVTHLAAASGGCRVAGVPAYVRALAHNRAILIRRYIKWFRAPVALARLALTALSFAVHYHSPHALIACTVGCIQGLRDGRRQPCCTRYAARSCGTFVPPAPGCRAAGIHPATQRSSL